jgi:hypothetical protein
VVKTTRDRAAEKREEKLALVREQVANGSLVIREMTAEERRRYPPRTAEPKPPKRRWAMPEREGLIARIRQIRRATADETARGPSTSPEHADVRALEARLAHLEELVQGLQDSVHRESSRHAKLLAELEARIQPAALGKALDEDARTRGL